MECTETHELLFSFSLGVVFCDILLTAPARALTSCTSEFFPFLISTNVSPSSLDDEVITNKGSF
jgi:hypothetical protein